MILQGKIPFVKNGIFCFIVVCKKYVVYVEMFFVKRVIPFSTLFICFC